MARHRAITAQPILDMKIKILRIYCSTLDTAVAQKRSEIIRLRDQTSTPKKPMKILKVLFLLVLLAVTATPLLPAQITESINHIANSKAQDRDSYGPRDIRSVHYANPKLSINPINLNTKNP
jgi:hypothetical protein